MARYGRDYGARHEGWREGREGWGRRGPAEGWGGAGPWPARRDDWRGGGYVGGGPSGYDTLYLPAEPYDRGFRARGYDRFHFAGGYGARHGGYDAGFGHGRGYGVGTMRRGPGPEPYRGWGRGGGWAETGTMERGRYDRGYDYGDEWGGPRGGLHGGDEGTYVETGDGRVRRVGGSTSDADRIHVEDVMTAEPETVAPGASVGDAARLMKDLDVGIIPVVEDGGGRRLAGVVTDRDLAVRVLAEGKSADTTVSEVMSRDVATVERGDTVHDVLDVMKRHRVRRVPVVDGEGRLVGIVAQADLAVDYAGLDLQRETEVEEAIERISEPAAPRRSR